MRNVPQTIADVNALTDALRRAGVLAVLDRFQTGDLVQTRIRGEVFCGVVRSLDLSHGEGQAPRIVVRTDLGTYRRREFDVRQCGRAADGRCVCAAHVRSTGAAQTPPLGNTGVAT